jgi:DNA-nicking Smr family endonuclease
MLDKKNNVTNQLQAYLINDTPYDYSFSIQLHLKLYKVWQREGKLDSMSFFKLPVFDIDFLNEAPEITSCFNRVSTEGPGPDIEKKMKLKAKSFFNHKQTAPFINQPAHLFILLEKSAGFDQMQKAEKDSLKKYTLEHAKPIVLKKEKLPNQHHSVTSKSEFSFELDLHIESITKDYLKLSNAQILQIQTKKFEDYMDEAVRQGVERVFIIHGIGKGHLRNVITANLIRNPHVMTFKNEYHPRYGHGATEVIFL